MLAIHQRPSQHPCACGRLSKNRRVCLELACSNQGLRGSVVALVYQVVWHFDAIRCSQFGPFAQRPRQGLANVVCTTREDIIVCEENSQVQPWAMASVHTMRGRNKRSNDFGLRKEYCGHTNLLLAMLSMMIESTEREVWLGAEHCDRYCLANQRKCQ